MLTSYLQHGKGNVHGRTGHEGTEVQKRYSSTLSLTSELDGVGGQRHAPAALPPGKTRYPLYRRLGGPHGRPGVVWKILSPTWIRSPDRPARTDCPTGPLPPVSGSIPPLLLYIFMECTRQDCHCDFGIPITNIK